MSTPTAATVTQSRSRSKALRFAVVSSLVALGFCALFTLGAKNWECTGFLTALVLGVAGLVVCRRWPRMAGAALILGGLVPLAVLAAFPTEGTRRMLGIVLASVGITISAPLGVSGVVLLARGRARLQRTPRAHGQQ